MNLRYIPYLYCFSEHFTFISFYLIVHSIYTRTCTVVTHPFASVTYRNNQNIILFSHLDHAHNLCLLIWFQHQSWGKKAVARSIKVRQHKVLNSTLETSRQSEKDYIYTVPFQSIQQAMLHVTCLLKFWIRHMGEITVTYIFFGRFLRFFLRFLKPFLQLLFMVSALGQNDRYNRYISAFLEQLLRVTAELIKMVQ